MAEPMFSANDGLSGYLNPYTRFTEAGTQVIKIEIQKSMATFVYAHLMLSIRLEFPFLPPLPLDVPICGTAEMVTR